ncbi:MAG TPA: prolyl oligopeptidase family serine peptidase [Gemmataceae bacterium]|nr:prolyl oligopeptidase family serine peptidase [Gemmataceae bacterium]
MFRQSSFLLILIGALSAASRPAVGDEPIQYPQTRRVDHIDDYHGSKVPDPYRWLEQDVRESKEVAEWVAAENAVTFAYLAAIPERAAIRRRLRELWNYERYSAPRKVGGRYFFSKNDGLQNQDVLYVLEALEGTPRVLLDPNQWSKDGTVALAGLSVSKDGKYVAYSIAEAGSDWQTWHVVDVASGKVLPDEIRWTKYRGTSWTHDGKGFFYGRYDEPKPGAKFQNTTLNQKIYYHRVGAPQAEDVLVYRRPEHPEWDCEARVTEDGRYLVFTTSKGTAHKHRIAYKDLEEPYGMPIDLVEDFDNQYTLVGNDGPVFYFQSDLAAPRGRLIAIDLRRPERKHWKEIIPQAREALSGIGLVGNMFIASYLKDARTQVKMYATDGSFVREVQFPAIGSAAGFAGRRSDTETFYNFQSYAMPPSIYRYDLLTGKNTLFRQPQVKFDPTTYEVRQVFYKSKDGTQVPMFLAHKKGIQLDGSDPTLLYGYGGFSIPSTPRFSVAWLGWLDMGGVLAVANLRGGSEYGEEWHLAGTRLHKQNVFDDFIAAAEWLVAHHVTRTERLAIEGRSNGGLLVGAALTQRPDLFGACLPGVGVMDMLRFNQFTAGRYWVDDYGSPQNPAEFKALRAYSPYHNIKEGTKYPATLVTTADTDDRVVPGHSFKFAAELQHAQAGRAPVLIRIETRAGHGGGKPTAKLVDETADEWAFLVKNLKMELPPGYQAAR